MSYAQTLTYLKQWSDARHVPLRYVQLDSWWYEWGADRGVDQWQPRSDARTFGADARIPSLDGLPLQLHNRFFSRDTRLRGRFDFELSDAAAKRPMAFPRAIGSNLDRLYDELFANATARYGLAVYEQDWLQPQVLDMAYGTRVVGAADAWLTAMAGAAARHHVEILYCMAGRADLLLSTQLPAVRAVRVSHDYAK